MADEATRSRSHPRTQISPSPSQPVQFAAVTNTTANIEPQEVLLLLKLSFKRHHLLAKASQSYYQPLDIHYAGCNFPVFWVVFF